MASPLKICIVFVFVNSMPLPYVQQDSRHDPTAGASRNARRPTSEVEGGGAAAGFWHWAYCPDHPAACSEAPEVMPRRGEPGHVMKGQ